MPKAKAVLVNITVTKVQRQSMAIHFVMAGNAIVFSSIMHPKLVNRALGLQRDLYKTKSIQVAISGNQLQEMLTVGQLFVNAR